MKILLYSYSFWPGVGGVERVSHNLAKGLAEAGHSVTVVTETMCEVERPSLYKVVRRPDSSQLSELVKEHDLVHVSGSAIRCFFPALKYGKPFSWTHHGYQLQCIDGAGWVNGAPAPMTPMESIQHHRKLFGMKPALIGGGKLWLRRWVGGLAAANVATSRHAMSRQKLSRERLIYNPIDLERIAVSDLEQAAANLAKTDATFTYVGRLVTEKGVDDLIYAFSMLSEVELKESGQRKSTLKILGDGPEKESLQRLAQQLGVGDCIKWDSALLVDESDRVGICVIPSAWEEPGALIVLELMAAGKPMIVSERGCLSECAGDSALTFPNRDRAALLRCMLRLYKDRELQLGLVGAGLERIKLFDPKVQVGAYLDLFDQIKAGS